MKMKAPIFSAGLIVSFLGLPGVAQATGPEDLASPEDSANPAVWGGQETELCGWPTVVNIFNGNSSCSGTLIHPRVVSYAAHCGASNTTVRFGENSQTAKTADVDFCMVNPGWGGNNDVGDDYAFCVLTEDIPMPVTPPIHGCELNQVSNGTQAALVGFGNNSGDSGAGQKRWGYTTLTNLSWNGNTVRVGEGNGDVTLCSGDSGGPLFVQYGGAWHTLGIASVKYAGTCNSAAGEYALLNGALPWIEQNSGINVTACQDLNGNWDPTPYCGNFLTSGPTGVGANYNTWCEGTPGSGWWTGCGPGWDTFAETNPPNVAITYPADGQTFAEIPSILDIQISASDDSGYMDFVQIEIDGMLIPNTDEVEPYTFEGVSFPEGTWTIRAYGEDTWGNSAWSAPVTVIVGDGTGTTGSMPTTGAETSGTTDNSEAEVGTDSEGGATTTGLTTGPNLDTGFLDGGEGGQESGCACAANEEAPGGLGLALLGLLGLWRRRRAD